MNLPFCKLINKVAAWLDLTMLTTMTLTLLPTMLHKEGSKEGIGKEGKRGKEVRKDTPKGRFYHFCPNRAHRLFFRLASRPITYQHISLGRLSYATSRLT